MRRSIGALVVSIGAIGPPAVSQAPPDSGGFILYKLQHPVGTERYRARQVGDGVRIETGWKFNYLGSEVTLDASLTLDRDRRPVAYVINGGTSTMTTIDLALEIRDGRARVRLDSADRSVDAGGSAFPISHYPPLAIEQELYRYWRKAGKPAAIPLLPAGLARFVRVGADTVAIGRRSVALDRYAVHGLVWGAQSAWFSDDRLIAVANGDAELDRFEAIREGFESMLPVVVRRSVEDEIAAQATVARRVQPIHKGRFAIVGARVIDGRGGTPLDNGTIVVEGGTISSVGPRARVTVPAGVSVINGEGKTVLPGLWDVHAHYEQAAWPIVSLAAGVTTARDAANEFELITALRQAIASGRILGPRLLAAGVIDGGEYPLGVVTAATPEEARRAVARYADAGFEQIKIYQSLPPALVPVVVEEAHRRGLTVTGHVPTGMSALQFIDAGADQINHLNFVTAVLRTPPAAGQPAAPIDLHSEAARQAIERFKARGICWIRVSREVKSSPTRATAATLDTSRVWTSYRSSCDRRSTARASRPRRRSEPVATSTAHWRSLLDSIERESPLC